MNYKVFMSFAFAALMLCSCKNSKSEAARNVDTQSEITDKEYLTGHFVSDYDGSNLTVSAREDGRYNIVISLFRLTYTATLTFIHSTWPLIEEGAKWEFKRK